MLYLDIAQAISLGVTFGFLVWIGWRFYSESKAK